MDTYVDLRIDDIEDFSGRMAIEWTVLNNKDPQFSETDLHSVFQFGNRDKFIEKTGVKASQCEKLKGNVFRARVYKRSGGVWLVAPESLKSASSAQPFNPVLSKTVSIPTPSVSVVTPPPTPISAPEPAKEKPKAVYDAKLADAGRLAANYMHHTQKHVATLLAAGLLDEDEVSIVRHLYSKFRNIEGAQNSLKE